MLQRMLLVWANLRIEDNRFVQSSVYAVADRSEKAGISYTIGQTMAHLFLTRMLGVPYTLHVDRYAQEFNIAWTDRGRWRPDLIALGTGWIVAEAKGRTWGVPPAMVTHAVQQKHGISTIDGAPPILRVASAAHFELGPLAQVVRDPEPSAPIDIPGDRGKFVQAYYRPLVEATRNGETRTVFGRQARFVEIEGLDVSIGLEEGIASAYSSPGRLLKLAEQFSESATPRDESDERRAIDATGVAMALGPSWGEVLLRLEPADRPSLIRAP
jgi:hypothetical protein